MDQFDQLLIIKLKVKVVEIKLNVNNGDNITKTLQKSLINDVVIVIPKGRFYIDETIKIPSNVVIKGEGNCESEIFLCDHVNANMFTNINHKSGNKNIHVENLALNGNWEKQFKPDSETRVSFCNIFYICRGENITFKKINAFNCYQTALHFNNSNGINIDGLFSKDLGWSGISTSGTNNLIAKNVYVYNSGNDHRHSAIHLDGGRGAYLECTVIKCNGNGVMLDSTFSDFSHAVVKANCSECMRGVSLIGSPKSQPQHILIKSGKMSNNDIGIMVSNSQFAFIDSVELENNSEVGILFQGRVGGLDSVVTGCSFSGNEVDIKEIHSSKNNLFYMNSY